MAANNPSLVVVSVDAAELEPWRRFFSGADIFNVIAHAILVAATDSPQEFRRRRDSIVEQIYVAPACAPTMGMATAGEGPTVIAKHVSTENGGNDDDVATRIIPDEPEGGKEEKDVAAEPLATAINQHVVQGHGGDNNNASGGADAEVGLDWLDMLADEMDEATLETEEALRIKAILVDHHEQSADVLFESLRRLQLMQLTVDKLKSTEIGKAVAALKKHKSHQIKKLAHDITKAWKVVVDEWIAATKVAMADNKSLDKANSSAVEDEGGLAIPPMDVGNPPIAAARKPVSGNVIKTGTSSVQSLEAPKFGIGKRMIHLADMGLERTKRKLREAYEEAENGD
ncbi:hypothetical protein QOZ80_1BG0051750 [Eleusine coracana subsp. coracana]|nr:hypothetical protein QOZ80_1BG0051750 [Eleusine coracana subsp. coracana]